MKEESKQLELAEKAQYIGHLIARYLQDRISPQEYDVLKQWLGSNPLNAATLERIRDPEKFQEYVKYVEQIDVDKKLKELKTRMSFPRPIRSYFSKPWHYAAAACVLIVICVASFLAYKTRPGGSNETNVAETNDLQPGRLDRATLTLADGRTILLNEAKDGHLITQRSGDIIKQGGQIIFSSTVKPSDVELFNTVTTPKGGGCTMTLPDGTKVWLNAASSIKFPVSFTDNQRWVSITGEVYFEVAALAHAAQEVKQSFIVEVANKDLTVEVLGTHFNINAYPDEPDVKTTLLEGSVKIIAKGKSGLLQPGQQAQVNGAGKITVSNINTPIAAAWKNNMFRFDSTDLRTIMRQIGRWYNVDVQFEAEINKHYTAMFSRNKPASSIFRAIEKAGGVHFEVRGKLVKVKP